METTELFWFWICCYYHITERLCLPSYKLIVYFVASFFAFKISPDLKFFSSSATVGGECILKFSFGKQYIWRCCLYFLIQRSHSFLIAFVVEFMVVTWCHSQHIMTIIFAIEWTYLVCMPLLNATWFIEMLGFQSDWRGECMCSSCLSSTWFFKDLFVSRFPIKMAGVMLQHIAVPRDIGEK
jgi:hypothetical protein